MHMLICMFFVAEECIHHDGLLFPGAYFTNMGYLKLGHGYVISLIENYGIWLLIHALLIYVNPHLISDMDL